MNPVPTKNRTSEIMKAYPFNLAISKISSISGAFPVGQLAEQSTQLQPGRDS